MIVHYMERNSMPNIRLGLSSKCRRQVFGHRKANKIQLGFWPPQNFSSQVFCHCKTFASETRGQYGLKSLTWQTLLKVSYTAVFIGQEFWMDWIRLNNPCRGSPKDYFCQILFKSGRWIWRRRFSNCSIWPLKEKWPRPLTAMFFKISLCLEQSW